MQDYILHKAKAVVRVPLSKIYYVTTHPTKAHALVFVTLDGEFEASMSLSKLEATSSGNLVRCHRKFLVNKSKIMGFNYDDRTIMFMDHRIADISCSRRYFALLKDDWCVQKEK